MQDSLAVSPDLDVVDALAVPAKALANTTQVTDLIQKGGNTFMEAVPSLVRALDEVAKIHPFIGGKHLLLSDRIGV